jgi:hypothetical protein
MRDSFIKYLSYFDFEFIAQQNEFFFLQIEDNFMFTSVFLFEDASVFDLIDEELSFIL